MRIRLAFGIMMAGLLALAAAQEPKPASGVGAMYDPDPAVRIKAVQRADLDNPAAVDELYRLLGDPTKAIRKAALERLGGMASRSLEERKRLFDAIPDAIRANPKLAWDGATILGQSADPYALEKLAGLLASPDPYIREMVSGPWGNLHPKGGDRLLIPLLEHTNRDIRIAAGNALVNYDKTPWKEEIARIAADTNVWGDQPTLAPAVLKDQMPVELFLNQSRHPDPKLRTKAVWEMHRWQDDPRVTDRLLELLDDPAEHVVGLAAERLGRRKETRARERILALTRSSSAYIREHAIDAMKMMEPEKGQDLRIEALKTDSPLERWSWARGFIQRGPSTSEYARLLDMLLDPDYAVAGAAAGTLARYDDGASRDRARAALAEWTARLRKGIHTDVPENVHEGWIIERLGLIATHYSDTDAVPCLVEGLSMPCERGRRGAARALGPIGDPRALPPLLKAITVETDDRVRRTVMRSLGYFNSPEALQAVEKALADADAEVAAEAAVSRLRQSGPASLHPELYVGAMGHASDIVRDYAFDRILESGDTQFLGRLVKAYGTSNDMVRPLGFLEGLAKHQMGWSATSTRYHSETDGCWLAGDNNVYDNRNRGAFWSYRALYLNGETNAFQDGLRRSLSAQSRYIPIEFVQARAADTNPVIRAFAKECLITRSRPKPASGL